MDSLTLADLQKPDERSLAATLFGTTNPEDAVLSQQQMLNRINLGPGVPDAVRGRFKRLQSIYAYGLLLYDLYTVVHDQARLVLEHALRERFVAFHGASVDFVDRNGRGDRRTIAMTDLYKDGRLHPPRGCHLVLSNGSTMPFTGMLTPLIKWARAEGLLYGQRNRGHETLLVEFRNRVAHQQGAVLLRPPQDAAMAISDLAEIINQLWGAATSPGRLYPAPLTRQAMVIGWAGDASGLVTWNFAEYFRDQQGLTCVVVRAVPDDGDLAHFDSLYQATQYPCELLWGPGPWPDAAAWLKNEQPGSDQVRVLDHLFVMRYHDGRLYLPQDPDVAASLSPVDQSGQWHLVQADRSAAAFNHQRQFLAGGFACTSGECRPCAVQTLRSGTWQDFVQALSAVGAVLSPRPVVDVRVTSSHVPRWNDSIGNGTWAVPIMGQ